jgi:hypothetical protein
MRSLTTEDDKTPPHCLPLDETKKLNGRLFPGDGLSSKGRGASDPITDSRPTKGSVLTATQNRKVSLGL